MLSMDDVRFGADIRAAKRHVRFAKADMCAATRDVRFGPKADMHVVLLMQRTP
jgi:hypothetical protein